MDAGTTLYYPYFHPRKVDSLKAALIYWDGVRRIVPKSVTHGHFVDGDSQEARLLTESGLLISTRPEPYEDEATRRFLRHVVPQSANFQIDLKTAKDFVSREQGIHEEKMGYKLVNELQKLGIARRVGSWVAMQDKLAAFYMFCLASEMSLRMSTPLLSDSPKEAALGEAFLFDVQDSPRINVGVSGTAITKNLIRLGLSLPSPKQLSNTPVERIVKFNRDRADERLAFRAAIDKIVEVARNSKDQNNLEDYLSTKRGEIKRSYRDLLKTLDEIGVGGVSTAAKITVPGALAGLATFSVSPATAAILSAVGLAIASISCYAETRGKLRQARNSSPYHYLLTVSNKFRTKVVD
jgi:hypothetical protein